MSIVPINIDIIYKLYNVQAKSYIYLTNELIMHDTLYSTFYFDIINKKFNIKLNTIEPNVNYDNTGSNLYVVPNNSTVFYNGNNKEWAQYDIYYERGIYYFKTYHNKFLGVINNKLLGDLDKSTNCEWKIIPIENAICLNYNCKYRLINNATKLSVFYENTKLQLSKQLFTQLYVRPINNRFNITIDTTDLNINKDGTGNNIYSVPDDTNIYACGNNREWAQFDIYYEDQCYYIKTFHNKYVAVIDNIITVTDNKIINCKWDFVAIQGAKLNIFASGSCRLLTSMNRINDPRYNVIHNIERNFVGTNFIGKLHTTKQHIQLLKFIKDEINIQSNELSLFLTTYNNKFMLQHSRNNGNASKFMLKNLLPIVDVYIFEISSIKKYISNNIHLQMELLVRNMNYTEQDYNEIVNDIIYLSDYLKKPIIFVCHFRPQIWNNNLPAIPNRELIYRACVDGCKITNNYLIVPPCFFIKILGSIK